MLAAPTRQGDVIIDIPLWNEHFDRKNLNVGMRISGGADSAILAYMLATYVKQQAPHLTIHPITCTNPAKPYQQEFAATVIAKIEELVGIKFATHQTLVLAGVGSYADEQVALLNRLYAERVIDCHIMGETMNPPQSVMDTWDGDSDGMPPERNISGPVIDTKGVGLRPLRQYHKQSVYDLYMHFDVLDTLFPLTRSCESLTFDFSSHCADCAFCKERFWGFGRYT